MPLNTSTLLLENYGSFIKDHETLFEDSVSAAQVISDDSYFEMYVDKLTSGLEESVVSRIKPILEREREMYIEESGSILTSPQAIAYAISSFPMLINIYAEPLLSKVVTVYPTDKPTMSIPKLTWISKIIDHAGNETEVAFPTARQMVRPDMVTLTLASKTANLFNLLGDISPSDFRISKRNFRVRNIRSASDAESILISVQADARGSIISEFDVQAVDSDGNAIIVDGQPAFDVYKIQGQVDFDSGALTWSVIQVVQIAGSENGADKFDAGEIDVKFRVFGNGNGRGVVKSRPKQEIIDIDMDIEDSFEVENIEEIIQDWKSVYSVNVLAELKNYVKDQIKLNRDFEIADKLEENIALAKKIGQYQEIDLQAFVGSATDDKGVRPTTVQDIFKNIVPQIMAMVERMRRQNNMDVQYLVCGIDVAVVLKSLQEFAVKMDGMTGGTGLSGTTGDFAKLEIVSSYAVEPSLLHFVTGANTLSRSSIVEVMYKPLYIINEITNSIRRTFIKSRNWIGIVRSSGIATIKLKNYEMYFAAAGR